MYIKRSIICLTLVVTSAVLVFEKYLRERKGEQLSSFGRYTHPWNSSLQGLEFQFTETTLKLVRRLIKELECGKRVDNISVDSYLAHLKPVTAVSSNHFLEIMAHLEIVKKFAPNVNIVLYDLGLKPNEKQTLENIPFVEYRKFDFSAYPKFVRKLKIYAWKILVIQQVLADFGGAMWFDASMVFRKRVDEMLPYMVGKNSSFLYYIYLAGHSIVSSIEPTMLHYLPMISEHLPADMPQSGAMLIFNTKIVRSQIMKWSIACVLLEDCISPRGSHLECGDNYPTNTFGGCHRYDQSVFAITVSNAYNLQYERYSLPKHLQVFAYPWRVRNDWFLYDRKAIPYYVIFFLTLGILIVVIVLRKRIKQLATRR